MSGTIEIEAAPGELVDKLAILEINHDWPGLTRHRIGPVCEKIIRRHQERLAIVYVRSPRSSRLSVIKSRRGCNMR
jgi:hypothetical protein